VINETMARRFWPGEDPLGRQVVFQGRTTEIVGIVQDMRPFRPDQELWPEIYWPKRQAPRGATYYVIRSRTPLEQVDRAAFERTVRARLAEVEPDLQLSGFTPLETIEARQLVSPRFNMLLVAAFALVALLLAAVGIYGVIAYTVAVRSREMAVRMALGARPGRVVGEVVRDASRLVGLGLLGGLAGALLLGRLMAGLIYGLSPVDPLALGGSALLLLATALVASWLPSRRAGRNDPAAALREQ
jgi:predicted lysophospholipase L1 biosynthesis ABC-type transport system permease subunit